MARSSGTRFGLSLLVLGVLPGHAATPTEDLGCNKGSDADSIDCATAASAWRAVEPALQLAEVYEPGIDLEHYLVSEKFDGVRAFWDGRRLLTRGGLVINAPAWFTAGFPDVPLDGELWMGRRSFAAVSGTVRRLQPELEAWRRVRYLLFDLPASASLQAATANPATGTDNDRAAGSALGFEQRLAELKRLVAASSNPHLAVVEQAAIDGEDALTALLAQVVADGGEGLMLHRRDAPYRAGRTSDLLKVKPYLEAEARVVGHLPGRGKYTGSLGSLLVEEADGKRFRIGTGFSDVERDDPPPIGSLVSFKYHGRTKNGLPRFASFLRVAEDL